ncbi:hypothetical protein Pan216_40670 [Planctomycetes bacterium Pan216]|uniref:Uncharacterized protein n=1 Tax=Kolteria novifilia TaxID=2527975 RepID=A0A518B8C5_9BACT|nr:hypothetical protein Pan216_40670 [Planctomycetes bacterium Pan216]
MRGLLLNQSPGNPVRSIPSPGLLRSPTSPRGRGKECLTYAIPVRTSDRRSKHSPHAHARGGMAPSLLFPSPCGRVSLLFPSLPVGESASCSPLPVGEGLGVRGLLLNQSPGNPVRSIPSPGLLRSPTSPRGRGKECLTYAILVRTSDRRSKHSPHAHARGGMAPSLLFPSPRGRVSLLFPSPRGRGVRGEGASLKPITRQSRAFRPLTRLASLADLSPRER